MRKITDVVILINITVLSFLFFSCSQDTSDEIEKDTVSEEQVAAVKESLTVTNVLMPMSITYADEPDDETSAGYISLKTSVPAGSGVTVSWSSGNTSIIADDGTVTFQDGTSSDTVTLTATVSRKSFSDTKVFTVKVYQKEASPCDDDFFAALKSKILFGYNTGIYKKQTIDLVSSITAAGKTAAVSWNTSDSKHFVLSGTGNAHCTVHRDIAAVAATITATLTCGTVTDSKTIAVTLDCIPEISWKTTSGTVISLYTYTFDGSTVECDYTKSDTSKSTASTTKLKYSYTADTANKTFKATVSEYYYDDRWYTKDEWLAYRTNYFDTMLAAYEAAEISPTVENLLTAYKKEFSESDTKTDLETYLVNNFSSYFNNVDSVTAFESLSTSTVKEGISSLCEYVRTYDAALQGLQTTASWQSIITAFESSIKTETDELFTENVTHDYNLDDSSSTLTFVSEAEWTDGTDWWKQQGTYVDPENFYYSFISLYTGSSCLYYRNTCLWGSYNTDYSIFVETNPDTKNWTVIPDAAKHTVEYKNGSDDFTLSFYGKELYNVLADIIH